MKNLPNFFGRCLMLSARPDGGAARCGPINLPDDVYHINLQTYTRCGAICGKSGLHVSVISELSRRELLYTAIAPTNLKDELIFAAHYP
jgi:hypothetical protein